LLEAQIAAGIERAMEQTFSGGNLAT